jgi:signal transduction histidine kinase
MAGAPDSPDLDTNGRDASHRDVRLDAGRIRELESTLAVIADAILIFDRAGRIVVTNRAARDLFSLDANPEIESLSMADRSARLKMRNGDGRPLAPDEIPGARALRGETVTGAQAVDVLFTSLRGREVEMNVTAMPIRDQAGTITGAVCVYRDVTHRRGLERAVLVERDRLRAVLQELRALEARRDEFLSSLSHDLKNPLTGLRGMAQLLHRQISRGTFDPESGSRRLEAMIETTGTMARMVDELVRASRQRVGGDLALEREQADLLALTRSFVAAQQSVVDQDIVIESDLPEVIAPVDVRQMERVISNLIWNAVKYSSRRSRVWVRLGVEDRQAIFSVRDEGIGIPVDELPHIFERYYRARNVDPGVPGTGVGLVSAQEIVQAHGGTIEVQSEEGAGSTFTVRLPLQE